jgi:hypothetical protein
MPLLCCCLYHGLYLSPQQALLLVGPVQLQGLPSASHQQGLSTALGSMGRTCGKHMHRVEQHTCWACRSSGDSASCCTGLLHQTRFLV